jgi:glutamate N-acetyltransferase/amino-acid N-acetyltransferase
MSVSTKSPLAPVSYPDLAPVQGVALATAATGMKYHGRDDLLLALLAPGTRVAGCLTRSSTASAPVDWCRRHLKRGRARALIVNAGNANAFTGKAGDSVVREIARDTARQLAVRQSDVFLASTGVIGEAMAGRPILGALADMRANAAPGRWLEAAGAIMTTDTFPKLAGVTVPMGSATVQVNGIAKGSGMIAPDMATMLAFMFTDAPVEQPVLQDILSAAVDRSFNAVTVDGDSSTSDTVLLFATGRAGRAGGADKIKPIRSLRDKRAALLAEAVDKTCLDLAHQIVRDGEGARKFITIKVTGAKSARAARVIAKSIANSPLVKTAIAGEDANWGRIVMAVGKSGEAANRDRLVIRIGGVRVTHMGAADPEYREAMITGHMSGETIDIEVDVGVGRGQSTVWTCDLTEGYIRINADYRS